MINTQKRGIAWLACGVGLFALAIPSLAYAQGATPAAAAPLPAANAENSDKDEDSKDIIVTGTLLRGVAPSGSQSLNLSRESIEATGATTNRELLATVPQIGNFFNALPQVGASSGVSTQTRPPVLRNLPLSIYASGSSTLLLVDGHRYASIGVNQFSPDPDAIPTGAIERVEIVTDGGSAIYGADAVGGVINYITRRRFDGIKVDGRYGFADNYRKLEANFIAGKDWGSGSAYVSYSFSKNDAVYGRDRDYIKLVEYNRASPFFGLPSSRQCSQPNITAGGAVYGVNGTSFALNQPNTCDDTDGRTLFPAQQKHSGFARLAQDFGDNVKLDVTGFYTQRKEVASRGDFRATVTIRPGTVAAPTLYYRPIPGNPTANQSIMFSLAPVYGGITGNGGIIDKERFGYKEWGITPQLTVDFGGGWQARLMANIGGSHSNYDLIGGAQGTPIDTTLLGALVNGTTAATAINPYDIASSTPAQLALLAGVVAGENDGRARDSFYNFRGIVDGSLFTLPGGDLKVAVGAEYFDDTLKLKTSIATGPLAIDNKPFAKYSRNVWALFGEARIPIFGRDNATTMFQSLELSLAARYDRYSDFGHTFNPKLGLTWRPVDWVNLRGMWGKSFNAPTPVDQLGAENSNLNVLDNFFIVKPCPAAPAICPAPPTAGTQVFLSIDGAVRDLKPQTSRSWSLGFDIDPPFIPGLRLSGTYYNIYFKGTLDKAPLSAVTLTTVYPEKLIFFDGASPASAATKAIIASYAALTVNPGAAAAILNGTETRPIYEIYDRRTSNLGNSKIAGLDFQASYNHKTSFGSIDGRIGGNYQLKRDDQSRTGQPYVDGLLTGRSLLSLSGSAGATIGNFRGQASMRHSSGYDIPPTVSNDQQAHIGSYTVFDLFFRYQFDGEGVTKDLSLTLNIDNVMDNNPPLAKTSTSLQLGGFANGQTLGRAFSLGISKKF